MLPVMLWDRCQPVFKKQKQEFSLKWVFIIDFSPHFEQNFHSKVVPSLLLLLDDYNNPRVQAHAGAALVNFFEECPQKIIINYLEIVVNKIEEVLNVKVKEVSLLY